MPASPLDSAIYRELLGDPELARLFTDSAEVRAMLLVEGALAEAQGAAGLIPAESAAAIRRASLEVQIDPAELAAGAGASAVPVPALVAAFRREIGAPEHADHVHWGATSQDIMDTALALRLRQALALLAPRLDAVIAALAALAEAHAELPMAARTYGQVATPTSFGAVAAEWGRPLLVHRTRLAALRPEVEKVSLSGAAGTLDAMGPRGADVRAALARSLGLGDPGAGWHGAREGVAGLAAWLAGLGASLGKLGEDVTLLAQSGIGEVALAATGGSSTMPQKANPVQPAVLGAIARTLAGLNATMQLAPLHRLQRDGAAWLSEWLTLPQMVILAGRALATATALAEGLRPLPEAMMRNLAADGGPALTEALAFALAERMPRPEAQAEAARLAAEARATGTPLAARAAAAHPGTDWAARLAPAARLGAAPAEARAFAAAARGPA